MGGLESELPAGVPEVRDERTKMEVFHALTGDVATADRTMDELCQEVIEGRSISEFARERGLPRLIFPRWVTGDTGRNAQYRAAVELAGDEKAHEGWRLVKEASVDKYALAKIQGDYCRWLAGKWNKAQYGDSARAMIGVELPELPSDPQMLILETARSLAYILEHAARAGQPVLVGEVAPVIEAPIIEAGAIEQSQERAQEQSNQSNSDAIPKAMPHGLI